MLLSCIRGKIEIVLDVVVLTTSWKIVWRILARPPGKGSLNAKEGTMKKGDQTPQKPVVAEPVSPQWGSKGLKTSQKVPYFIHDPLTWQSGPVNIAWVRVVGESSWALLDSGSTINAVTQEFVEAHSLDMGPLSDLANGTLGINGFRGVFSQPFGYVMIRAQAEGVWGYDEDHIALDLPDSTGFQSWVPVILGTTTINQIIDIIKESEINELSAFLNGLRIAQLLACWQAELLIQGEATVHQTVDPTNLKGGGENEKEGGDRCFLIQNYTQPNENMLLGNNMYVMTQSLKGGDGPHLPHGLSVVNMYTKVISGNKQVVVVMKNLTAVPITISKGINVPQVIAVNAVLPVEVVPITLEELDEVQGIQWTKMLVERRREVLFKQLDLSGRGGSRKIKQPPMPC